jgi:hypothetical protein
MEVELTTLDTTSTEAESLCDLLLDLLVAENPVPAIFMNSDNQMVKVSSAKDNVKSTRHVKRHLKSIRKLRNSRVIVVAYVQTDKNLTNPITKGLSWNVIEYSSREMGMIPM